jgi:tetratricopeptide (TPR) repeat protein
MTRPRLYLCFFLNLLPLVVLADAAELNYTITLLEIKPDGKRDTVSDKKVSIYLTDSSMFITKGNQRTVYDFAKEKVYFLNLLSKTYDETSLYAEVDYRQSEFFNRLKLKNFLNKDGIENQLESLFELESLFGITAHRNSSTYQVVEENKNNFSQYSIQSVPIIDLSFSSFPINTLSDIFYKYLLYETQIHPQIIKNILSKGRFPEKMKFTFSSSGKVYQAVYQLQSFTEGSSKIELEHKYFLFGYKTNKNLVTNINKVYGFVHHNQLKFPDKDMVIRNFEQQFKNKNYINAFLTITESTLATNNEYEAELKNLRAETKHNRKFQEFVQALIPPENPEELALKIEDLRKIQRKNKRSSKIYLINAFLGSYYNAMGYHDEALNSFDKVISQNPYLTTLYIDIGDVYTETHNMRMAWKCYDIAIKMNPNMSMVQKVLFNKKQLKMYFPDFFM